MFYIIMFSLVWVTFRIIFMFKTEGYQYIYDYKSNKRPYIICANHLNVLDPIFVVIARGTGRRLSIMGKAELFKNPILAWMFYHVGVFPVDRGTGDKSVIEKSINDIKSGIGMLIFPEGTRGHSDEMLKLKSGALMIAAQTGADIIPCRIIYPTKTKLLRPFGRVVVKFGEPLTIEQTQLDKGSKEQLRQVKAMLGVAFDGLLEEYYEHH